MLKSKLNAIKLVIVLIVWLTYSCIYLVLSNTDVRQTAGYFSLVGQVGLDILISIAVLKLYIVTNESTKKIIYFLFFISFISAVFSDGIYNVSMNIIDVDYFNKVNQFFEIPFILFLVFNALAWSKIFFSDDGVKNKKYTYYLTHTHDT